MLRLESGRLYGEVGRWSKVDEYLLCCALLVCISEERFHVNDTVVATHTTVAVHRSGPSPTSSSFIMATLPTLLHEAVKYTTST